MSLGSHPDLVERLWDQLGKQLPKDCRWVVYGTPTLVHPRSGIVFGFCGGTHLYALRLPTTLASNAIAKGAKVIYKYPAIQKLKVPERIVDVSKFGKGWILGNWNKEEEIWCREAYNHSGGQNEPT